MIAAVLVVSVLWTAGWMYVASRITAEAELLAEADGVSTPRLTCADFHVGGFPFSFSPHCTGAEILAGDVTVTLPEIRGTALFYRPTHIQFFADGPAQISDAFTGARTGADWSNLHASVRFDGSGLARASLIADNLAYLDMLFGQEVLGTAERGELHLIGAGADEASVRAQTVDFYVMLEGADSTPLEISNGTLTIDGQVSGVPEPALWGDPQVLAYWQALDGVLTLRGLEADADELMVSASGEARLNSNGLLNASLSVQSQGLHTRLAGLAEDALIEVFLGSPGEDGIASQRVTVNDGTVVVGILPLTQIPPLF